MPKFKGHWLKEEYAELPKHTRIQIINFRYLPKDAEFVEREGIKICSTYKGLLEIPESYIEEVPWWAE